MTKNWSWTSIWSKIHVSVDQAKWYVKEFERRCKEAQHFETKMAMQSRRKLKTRHLAFMKTYAQNQRGKYWNAGFMERALREQFAELRETALSTIRTSLRRDLGYSYKKLDIVAKRAVALANIRSFHEAARVQLVLEELNVERIYLYQFSINSRNLSLRGWAPISERGYLEAFSSSFSMSFVVAFSAEAFYGITGTTETMDGASTYQFICDIYKIRRTKFDKDDNN